MCHVSKLSLEHSVLSLLYILLEMGYIIKLLLITHDVVVQLLSRVQLFVTPWTAASQARLSFTISWSLIKLMTIELMMLSNISSSAATFSCPQFFPASGSFPMSRLFISGSIISGRHIISYQSIEVSASTSVLPMNIQGWFPLGLTCCPRDSQESSPAPQFKSINSSALSLYTW